MKLSRRAIIQLIVLVYCIGGILIYHFQDSWLLKPNQQITDYTLAYPYKEITIPMSSTSDMHLLQVNASDSSKGVVLFFGGRKGNAWSHKNAITGFPEAGYEVVLMDYPGYGTSTGTFSEDSVYYWSQIAYTFLRARFEPQQIILYGHDLGAAVASRLATRKDTRLLILSQPFPSYASLIKVPIYPVKRLLRYQFATEDYLPETIAPVLVVDNAKKAPRWINASERIEYLSLPGLKKDQLPNTFKPFRERWIVED